MIEVSINSIPVTSIFVRRRKCKGRIYLITRARWLLLDADADEVWCLCEPGDLSIKEIAESLARKHEMTMPNALALIVGCLRLFYSYDLMGVFLYPENRPD
jgi:hypothetical protein